MLATIPRVVLRCTEPRMANLAREHRLYLLPLPLRVYLPNTEAGRRDDPLRRAFGGNEAVGTILEPLHRFDRLLCILTNRFLDGASEQSTRRKDVGLVFAGPFGVWVGEQRPHFVPIVDVLQVVLQLRSEEHTSELQSQSNLVCRLLLEINTSKYSC